MQKLILAAIALASCSLGCSSTRAAEASTADEKAVMALVDSFVTGFNQGDAAKCIAMCTDEMAIIDEFPPHEWHGAGALAKWLADFDTNAKQEGITDSVVTCKPALHIDVKGEFAYVVAPSDYTWKKQGQPMKETDSLFTFALHKIAGGWKITGWSWANS